MNTESKSVKIDEFDIMEFCKRHFSANSRSNYKIKYVPNELRVLTRLATRIFKNEPMLARMSPPCTVIGDIHGQYRDLLRIIQSLRKSMKGDKNVIVSKCVFLGDFIDRGTHSTECICLVFALKILLPKNFVLLRGNHEIRGINICYGFRDELIERFGVREGNDVWECFNTTFSWMSVAALVGETILCMHGGIPNSMNSLEDINKITRPLVDVNESPLARDLLWADPMNYDNVHLINLRPIFMENELRGVSFVFNETAVKEFIAKHDLKLIVRGHQMMDLGFQFFADKKLVTIFSAPRYMKENENDGALLHVSENGAVSITRIQPSTYRKDCESSQQVPEIKTSKTKSKIFYLLKKE